MGLTIVFIGADEMMHAVVFKLLVKWKRCKFKDTERSASASKRSAYPTTSELPQVLEEGPLSSIPSQPMRLGHITTYTTLAQIPPGPLASLTLVVEEPGQLRIVIDIEDTADGEPESSECPLGGANILSASEEHSRPDVPTNPMHSPSASSGDDHPLSSFMPRGRRRKTQTLPISSPPSSSGSPIGSQPASSNTPKTTALVTPSLPPFELLLKAVPDVPSIDLLKSST